MSHEQLRVLVELDPLHDRLLDTQKRPHRLTSRTPFSAHWFWTLDSPKPMRERRAPHQQPKTHPRMRHKSPYSDLGIRRVDRRGIASAARADQGRQDGLPDSSVKTTIDWFWTLDDPGFWVSAWLQ